MAEVAFPYQVQRKLADGAVAEVFLAEERATQQQVVLKILRPELTTDPTIVGRFLDEAKLCRTLQHPNIVRHISAGRLADGRVFMVTEFLDGSDLRAWLRENGPLTPEQLVKVIVPLCDALEYIHSQGVVHRDLKPENIFLVGGLSSFWPKLLDFGLARFGGGKTVQTVDGALLTTPEYTSPEVVEGKKADARSDLYALGILMYECLTGAPPFTAANVPAVLQKHRTEKPPALVGAAEYLSPVIERCLAKSPEARFPSAKAVGQALTECRRTEAVGATLTSGEHPNPVLAEVGPAEKAGDLIGNYELVAILGEGSMGRVFLARHRTLGRHVAMKVMRPEHAKNRGLVQRFFQEARTVNQINHEHIVEIYDFVEEISPSGLSRAYCVMELLAGQSLGDILKKEPLKISRIARLGKQVCEALAAAHQVGVVHRDVKPDNIFVTEKSGVRDYVKVLDFGVAKLADTNQNLGTTLEGAIVGTPAYMAPEQARGEKVDFRSDVYAVGTVLYQMIAGKPPFEGKSFGQLVVQITNDPPPPLPKVSRGGERVPNGLADLVMKCLEKDPEKRPPSMGSLANQLSPFANITESQMLPLQPEPVAAAKPSRLPLLMASIGGGAVLLVLLAWLLFGARHGNGAVVHVSIASTPPGATVTRVDTGQTLGQTPLEVELPRDRPITLKLERDGYQPRQIPVKLDGDFDLSVPLASK